MLEWLFPTFAGCVICGKEDTLSIEKGVCKGCYKKLPFAGEANAAFYYKDVMPYLIQDLKYNNKRYLAKIFAELSRDKLSSLNYDLICFVPTRHKKQRGYNQAELIARAIDKSKTVDVLEKIKDTQSQTELSHEQRKQNVKGCFAVKDTQKILNKKILLVDDVYTTGSTVKECVKVLKEAGVKEIEVFTVCITQLNIWDFTS